MINCHITIIKYKEFILIFIEYIIVCYPVAGHEPDPKTPQPPQEPSDILHVQELHLLYGGRRNGTHSLY